MDRNEELINVRYDALMFAQTTEAAKRAAKALIEAVLGEEAGEMSLERGLREVCRKLRPAADPRDQERFEAEFLELLGARNGMEDGRGERVKVRQTESQSTRSTQTRQRAAA